MFRERRQTRVRGIRILLVSVSMLLMLSVLFVNEGKSQTTYMDVIPKVKQLSPGTLGNFKINITITDVFDLYAWQLNITWNPAVLNLTSHWSGSAWIPHIDFGNFMAAQPGGTTKTKKVNYVKGWAVIGESSKGEIPGVSGSGWLAQVEFTVLAYGSTTLDIASNYWIGGPPYATTFLLDSNLWDIIMTPRNGYFDNKLGGDVDSDRDVDYDDFIVLAGAYGSHRGQPAYKQNADFDYDDDVDYDDFIKLAGNYGKSV